MFLKCYIKGMKTSKEEGDKGEKLAVNYLKEKGYHILQQNYRYKRTEIDIIALHINILVFVEVKYRSNLRYGTPETFLSKEQERRITIGATHYIEEHNFIGDIRFDVIAICKSSIEHFKDYFFPCD